jgi:hypothetical protein
MLPTAAASLAACLERSRLGIAIVAMIRMMATTIKSSSNENPFLFFKLSPYDTGPNPSLMNDIQGLG